MCTIICKYNPSHEYQAMFVENRDRPLEGFEGNDIRIIDSNKLVCIFDCRSQGIATGYSLATGIFGGVANIIGHVGQKSRGHVLRDALSDGGNLGEVLEVLTDELKTAKYSSARYVIADATTGYVVENFREELNIQRFNKQAIITNRFKNLEYGNEEPNAIERERYVRHQLGTKDLTLKHFMGIAQKHDSRHAVCRHEITVASLLIGISRSSKVPEVYYAIGHPCKGFKQFQVM